MLRRPRRVWEVQQYPPLGVWAVRCNSLKTSLSSPHLLPGHIQPLAYSRTQLMLRNILAGCNNKFCMCPTHACLLQTSWVAFIHPHFPFSTWLTKNCICSHKKPSCFHLNKMDRKPTEISWFYSLTHFCDLIWNKTYSELSNASILSGHWNKKKLWFSLMY